jgi:hypothetical protein
MKLFIFAILLVLSFVSLSRADDIYYSNGNVRKNCLVKDTVGDIVNVITIIKEEFFFGKPAYIKRSMKISLPSIREVIVLPFDSLSETQVATYRNLRPPPPKKETETIGLFNPPKNQVRVSLVNGNSFEGYFISSNDSNATYQSNLGSITINKTMVLSVQPINAAPSSNFTGSPRQARKDIVRNPVSVALKFCVDVAGSHKSTTMNHSSSMDVNTGKSVGFEVGRRSEESFNYAIGLTYLIPREQVISGSGNFNFMPIYAVGKIRLTQGEESIKPIFIANVGYNVLFNGDTNYKGLFSLSGGLYIAGGLRLEIDKFFFEGLYKLFNGSAKYGSGDATVNINVAYTTFSLALGVLL